LFEIFIGGKGMKSITDQLSEILGNAFTKAGYEAKYGQAVISGRPDLCQFQCNGALPNAKLFKKSPMVIANEVVSFLADDEMIEKVEVAAPGFINIILSDEFLVSYLTQVFNDSHLGIPQAEHNEVVVLDYGNPNVAKPLHVGHLRSTIIGESLKRIIMATGRTAIGDVHLGDWGLPMGLVLAELDERYGTDIPTLTTDMLNEIYPFASKKSKIDEAFLEKARTFTAQLQKKDPYLMEIWEKMIKLSVDDIRIIFDRLNATFDFWYGESDSSNYVPELLSILRDKKLLTNSEGAQVVMVAEDDDKSTIPPVIIIKSNGSEGYATTDVATIIQRQRDFNPDKIWYVVDHRQNLHFTQVFRAARKAELVPNNTELTHLCFGTVNGKDGKPFKTRDGGVMQLSELLDSVTEYAYQKMRTSNVFDEHERRENAEKIGVAAIKFGDLINHYSKDCIFDIDKFMASEGKTGVYLLYVIARINSILRKIPTSELPEKKINGIYSDSERDLIMVLSLSGIAFVSAYNEKAPNIVCENAYKIAVAFSKFYQENHIINEDNMEKKQSWLTLCEITKQILEKHLYVLGIESVERM
jgi:arginyl-tRNA synthetase